MFAGGSAAIMTTLAATEDLVMIHGNDRHPEIDRVTVLANIGGIYMCGRFTGCLLAVVTTATTGSNTRMIKEGGRPAFNRVTGITLIRALDM